MNVLLFSFMGLTAGADLVKREIPGWMFWVFGVPGVMGSVSAAAGNDNMLKTVVSIGGSISVGVVLLVLSHLVRGAVGEGDGWFFLVTGFYTSWKMNLGLLCYGLLFCCVYGMILMIWGRCRGVSVRKKKIPLLPFVWLAGMMLLAGGMWEV